jgi:hypothetical protein
LVLVVLVELLPQLWAFKVHQDLTQFLIQLHQQAVVVAVLEIILQAAHITVLPAVQAVVQAVADQ